MPNNSKRNGLSLSDSELWKQIISGDERSWRDLIAKYEPLVYAVATRSRLSYAESADCFQQTWVNLYKNRKKIQDPNKISAWLVTTAKREVIRIIKKRLTGQNEEHWLEIKDDSLLPDEEVERIELRNLMQFGIGQIDERCQRLLKLLFFAPENNSYQEVARKLNISPNALGPARKRCLGRLKKELEKNGPIDALI